jgi:hypothetical protein
LLINQQMRCVVKLWSAEIFRQEWHAGGLFFVTQKASHEGTFTFRTKTAAS